MFDGTIKCVQNVVVGDVLMGDDSTPRTVLSLGRGKDNMYKITHDNEDFYTVNSEHILCLKYSNSKRIKHQITRNRYVVEYFDGKEIKRKSFTYDDESQKNMLNEATEYFNSIDEKNRDARYP